jgi:hypothetical protein
MERHEIEALRLAVLANGYTPIRNVDKRTFMPSWPTVTITEDEVRDWTRKFSRHAATGLRIENGLCAIDFDVDDEEAMTAIVDAVLDAHPELEQSLLRWGKGAKEAWFLRCDELFTRLHTRAFIKPGETADDATHRVEIFGGGSPRQFGAFGAHTKDERTGEVLVEYDWADARSPQTVLFDDLLEVPKSVLWSVIDIAEQSLIALGWQIFERSKRGESASGKVYDLTDDMMFQCNDDIDRTLDELREAAKGEEHLRCSASWLEGPTAVNRTRCLVSLARSGGVVIWESMEGVSHHEKVDEPIDYGPMIDRMAEKLVELRERKKVSINAADDFDSTLTKLDRGYAFCPTQKAAIVPLWATSLDEGYTMVAFRQLLQPYTKEEKGPRGGVKKINPVDAWMSLQSRTAVEGLRMRPDRERPTFKESGKLYLNVYSPPDHRENGGDVRPGLQFVAHLLPDPEERDWFLRWLSFKLRYPHIPGPAVVMVAHATFGTGRGTLAELVSRLFGESYVRQLPFATFTGKNYQSQYNDWQSEALMVCVNESAESENASTYQTKQNTYEHLKEIVEVRPTKRLIKVKGDRNYWALSSTSFLIFTNHMDALPIPEHDRRFAVLTNGDSKPVTYWTALNKWMDEPGNVAAFYAWLIEYELGDYSPYAKPPTFSAKATMIDEAKSDLDSAIGLALDNMPGAAFTLPQLGKYVKLIADKEGLELPRPFENVFRKVCRRRLVRVGVRDGVNWKTSIGDERYAVYARTKQAAAKLTDAAPDDIRAAVVRNGEPDASGSNVLAGFFKKHDR